MTRRYVVLGAGAIGAGIGGRVFEHGHDVLLVARGANLEALRTNGLVLGSRLGEATLRIPAAGSPAEVGWRPGDVVLLAVMSQHTAGALHELSLAAPPSTPIVCAQNGVSNEPETMRWFANVYGLSLQMPSAYVEPGRVFLRSAPVTGIIDVGRYPAGAGGLARSLAADFAGATFEARAVDDVMRFKYRKMLRNLNNAVFAAVGPDGVPSLAEATQAEALAVFAAAGIVMASGEDDGNRRANVMTYDGVPGWAMTGSSTWQSLARGTGSIEADYLNGEVCRLGRLHGVPTPVNAALQRIGNRLARDRAAPGSMTATELEAAVAREVERARLFPAEAGVTGL